MALERTVLNNDLIIELVERYYGFHITSVQKLELGSANCYRISDGICFYFLKEFQSSFQKEDLIREAKLAQYLTEQGVCTARYYPTVEGAFFFEVENHLVCLEEYIEGITSGYDNFPQKYMLEMAAVLGKLHRALANYDLPMDMDEKWLNAYSVEREAEKYDRLLEGLEQNQGNKYYNQIKADLIYKKKLSLKGDDLKKYYKGITYTATHGDFQGCQLICDDEHIKAIIDFSSARVLPAVWEVMRSHVQSSEYCNQTAKIDTDGLCAYVSEYMKYFPLSEMDLRSMPYVYLFQLMRSTFGYPQYLKHESEDSEQLLNFAFWRTNMCRELEEKAEMISNQLLKLKR